MPESDTTCGKLYNGQVNNHEFINRSQARIKHSPMREANMTLLTPERKFLHAYYVMKPVKKFDIMRISQNTIFKFVYT